jgi:hypothetical protein
MNCELDHWTQIFTDTAEQVLRHGLSPSDVCGSTSLRAAIGLLFGRLDQTCSLTEAEAWEYLDPANASTVRFCQREFASEIEALRGRGHGR